MTPTFDLTERSWLPCVMLDGSYQELGLRDTLLRAHEVRELYDPSPLVTVALHRLLLAILHRSHDGPANLDAWCDLWRRGRWDEQIVGEYLDRWSHRFDLFDTVRPFYQVPFKDGVKVHPIARLAHEAASANNPTLFDHSHASRPVTLSAGAAARQLVAAQAFALGGGVSKPFNLMHAPLVNGYTVLVQGENLFETLALNLAPYNAYVPIERTGQDLPSWEVGQPRVPSRDGTPPHGFVDYLTWQSRQVHLLATADGNGVTSCQVQQNLQLAVGPTDPFKAYRRDPERGFVAKNLSIDRAVWRDSHALVNLKSEMSEPPDIFRTLARIDEARRAGRIEARSGYQFGVYGLANDQARVDLWRTERLPLPLAYLNDDVLRDALGEALAIAEATGKVVRSATRQLAKLLLSPASDDAKQRQPPQDVVSAFSLHLGATSDFWSRLDVPFRRLMVRLPNDPSGPDADDPTFGVHELPAWEETLRTAATDAFDAAARGFDRTGRHVKATTQARRDLRIGLASTLGSTRANGEVQDGAAD